MHTADTADMVGPVDTAGTAADAAATVAAGMTKREGRRMLNTRLLTWSLGLFVAVSFLVCVVYGMIAPEPLHMHSALEVVLPGFRWLTIGGFLIGLLESFLYGVYGGLVFGWIYNALWKSAQRRATR